VRLVDTPRQPLRAVVDARLDTPPSARLFEADGPLVFYVAHPDPARRRPLPTAVPKSSRCRAPPAGWIWRPCFADLSRRPSTNSTSKPARA
jgi:diaminohydroxyphosphoribosylaminopyrimidine deaminase/5-amino-6-(5-phosphoribosylamino)uracil reductase